MIVVIISIDPSTLFLFKIIEELKSNSIEFLTIEVHPNNESYKDCLEQLKNLPENTTILFLGHGQDDQIYGFRIAKTNKAIGFGPLPTEMEEVDNDKKLANEGITLDTIELFKQAINETIILSLLEYFKDESKDFIYLKDYLNLLLNKRINKAIFEEDNRNLADLLFNMKNDMVIY